MLRVTKRESATHYVLEVARYGSAAWHYVRHYGLVGRQQRALPNVFVSFKTSEFEDVMIQVKRSEFAKMLNSARKNLR